MENDKKLVVDTERAVSWRDHKSSGHTNDEWAQILETLSEFAPTGEIAHAARIGADAIREDGPFGIAKSLLKDAEAQIEQLLRDRDAPPRQKVVTFSIKLPPEPDITMNEWVNRGWLIVSMLKYADGSGERIMVVFQR